MIFTDNINQIKKKIKFVPPENNQILIIYSQSAGLLTKIYTLEKWLKSQFLNTIPRLVRKNFRAWNFSISPEIK